MRLKNSALKALISNTTLTQEQLSELGVLEQATEKKTVSVILDSQEFSDYHKYCREHCLNRSEQTRVLLDNAMNNATEIFDLQLSEIKTKRPMTFLVPQHTKMQLTKILYEKQLMGGFMEGRMSESEFVRRVICCFLKKEVSNRK